jgi:hypothetical protein
MNWGYVLMVLGILLMGFSWVLYRNLLVLYTLALVVYSRYGMTREMVRQNDIEKFLIVLLVLGVVMLIGGIIMVFPLPFVYGELTWH